jgi:hypothetical protein
MAGKRQIVRGRDFCISKESNEKKLQSKDWLHAVATSPVRCNLDSNKAIELIMRLLPICSLLVPPKNSWLRAWP